MVGHWGSDLVERFGPLEIFEKSGGPLPLVSLAFLIFSTSPWAYPFWPQLPGALIPVGVLPWRTVVF